MSRYRPSVSYGHHCQRISWMGETFYRISWTYDRYYEGVRGRWPRVTKRDTDEKGARRFCKRHGIQFPSASTEETK